MEDPNFYGSVTVKGSGGRGIRSWEILQTGRLNGKKDSLPENGTLTPDDE